MERCNHVHRLLSDATVVMLHKPTAMLSKEHEAQVLGTLKDFCMKGGIFELLGKVARQQGGQSHLDYLTGNAQRTVMITMAAGSDHDPPACISRVVTFQATSNALRIKAASLRASSPRKGAAPNGTPRYHGDSDQTATTSAALVTRPINTLSPSSRTLHLVRNEQGMVGIHFARSAAFLDPPSLHTGPYHIIGIDSRGTGYEGGLRLGHEIQAIGNESVEHLDSDAVSSLLRGPPLSSVLVTIRPLASFTQLPVFAPPPYPHVSHVIVWRLSADCLQAPRCCLSTCLDGAMRVMRACMQACMQACCAIAARVQVELRHCRSSFLR